LNPSGRTNFNAKKPKELDVAIHPQQLRQLGEAPSERLEVELKGWLNLTDNGPRGYSHR